MIKKGGIRATWSLYRVILTSTKPFPYINKIGKLKFTKMDKDLIKFGQQINTPQKERNPNAMRDSIPEDENRNNLEKAVKIEQIQMAHSNQQQMPMNQPNQLQQPQLHHQQNQQQQLMQQVNQQRSFQIHNNQPQRQLHHQMRLDPIQTNQQNQQVDLSEPTINQRSKSKNSQSEFDHKFTKTNTEKILGLNLHQITYLRLINLFANSVSWPQKSQIDNIIGQVINETQFEKIETLWDERYASNIEHIFRNNKRGGQQQSSTGNINSNGQSGNSTRNKRAKKQKYNNRTRPNNKHLIKKVEELRNDKLQLTQDKLAKCENEILSLKLQIETLNLQLTNNQVKLNNYQRNSDILMAEKLILKNRLTAAGINGDVSNDQVITQMEEYGSIHRSLNISNDRFLNRN